MSSDLTKTLLLEEAAPRSAVGEALVASVGHGVPLLHALIDRGATTEEALGRYLARSEAPVLRQVVAVLELVDRLPPGLPARLLAVPVRRDAITGTIDVAVADAEDPHPGQEISFHLGAPVRLVRAPLAAIDDALRRLRARDMPAPKSSTAGEHRGGERGGVGDRPERGRRTPDDDDRLYDSRPRPTTIRPPSDAPAGTAQASPHAGRVKAERVDAETAALPRRLVTDRHSHVVPPPARKGEALPRPGRDTPPWGTPIHNAMTRSPSESPRSGLGSEIPIPLMRRTFSAVSGGTQRPPPLRKPADSALGEGYPLDPGFLAIVEVRNERGTIRADSERPVETRSFGASSLGTSGAPGVVPGPMASFIPGPPPVPATAEFAALTTNAEAPRRPADAELPREREARPEGVRQTRSMFPAVDAAGVLGAIRSATSRDEVLDLLLSGSRVVALRVALFVVKRGGYQGWSCTPEFGDRAFLQTVIVPLEGSTVFEEAIREGAYLGPIRHDEAHATLLHVMRGASRDVAVVPIRVSGRPLVVIVADELGDTMLGTRRLEDLAKAAGEAFTRILRQRR